MTSDPRPSCLSGKHITRKKRISPCSPTVIISATGVWGDPLVHECHWIGTSLEANPNPFAPFPTLYSLVSINLRYSTRLSQRVSPSFWLLKESSQFCGTSLLIGRRKPIWLGPKQLLSAMAVATCPFAPHGQRLRFWGRVAVINRDGLYCLVFAHPWSHHWGKLWYMGWRQPWSDVEVNYSFIRTDFSWASSRDRRRCQLGWMLPGCPPQFLRQLFIEFSQDRKPVCHASRLEATLWTINGRQQYALQTYPFDLG